MELNTKGRYAVMAMADLAAQAGDRAVSLSGVAERQNLSLAYLEQLFRLMRNADLVISERGRSGGYRLARPADQINVAEIMAAVDEDVRMTRCPGDGSNHCLGKKKCLTHELWFGLGRSIETYLSGISLRDILDGIPADKLGRPTVVEQRGARA